MGPQQPPQPRRVPMGRPPEEAPAQEPGAPVPTPAPISPTPEEETSLGQKRTPAYRLNTVPCSGNTTNNPDNNITARTLEEGAGLER